MAFWIKWEKGLTRKQEVLQIAARLAMPAAQAAGCLMLVMEWLDDNVSAYSDECHALVPLLSLPVSFLDTISGVTGFAAAMQEVGWLRVDNGTLVFVNAGRHNGKSAKKRMIETDRKRNYRSRNCPTKKGTKSRSLSSLLISSGSEGVQGEKRTESVTVIPLLLSTDEFRAAWADWLKHRREKGKPLAPGSMAERKQLKKLEEWGVARAIAAIGHSISNDWQGIFEPDPNSNPHANTPQRSGRGFEQQQDYAGVHEKL